MTADGPARICVTGIWHQGAVLCACLADLGHEVVGVADPETVSALRAGEPPVHEPELGEILARNIAHGRLRLTTDYAEGVSGADFVFISTDTPVDDNDRSDLTPIGEIADAVAAALTGKAILCVTAQVPVGTSKRLAVQIAERSGHAVNVAYVPEFLRLGAAVETFREADRFVVGADDERVAARVGALFAPLGRPLLVTDVVSAEMGKHAANAFLAASISFINEIADLCETLGADPIEVARILKSDRRIGPHAFLSPGLGFAGGTLGREIRALQELGRSASVPTTLLDAVWEVNVRRPELVRRRLVNELGDLRARRIAVLGLTYKPGTSTLRRAVSLEIARDLSNAGASVVGFDPLADLRELPADLPLEIAADVYTALSGAHAAVLVTEWDGLHELDFERLREPMLGGLLLDTRHALEPERMRAAGFEYRPLASS